MSIEIIGWIATVSLGVCGIPQVVKTFRTKKADDISLLFVGFWLVGEIAGVTYTILAKKGWPLITNYSFNLTLLLLLISLIYKYRK